MRRRKWERERSRGRAGAWLTAWGTLRGGKGGPGDERPAGAKDMDDGRLDPPLASRRPQDVKSSLMLDYFVLETRCLKEYGLGSMRHLIQTYPNSNTRECLLLLFQTSS